MKKIAIVSILTLFCAFTCALFAGVVSAQGGWKKTVTLQSGEVVLDMSGEWDVLVETYGTLAWKKFPPSILLITQQGNKFTAVKQNNGGVLPKGTESIKGELDKDGFKEVQYFLPHGAEWKWIPCKGEISEDGNKVVVDDGERHKTTLSRR